MKNAANVSLFIHRADWNRLSKKVPPRLLSFYQEMQEYACCPLVFHTQSEPTIDNTSVFRLLPEADYGKRKDGFQLPMSFPLFNLSDQSIPLTNYYKQKGQP